jgi:hypothetical protein
MLDFIGGFFLGFGSAFAFWIVIKQVRNPEEKHNSKGKRENDGLE